MMLSIQKVFFINAHAQQVTSSSVLPVPSTKMAPLHSHNIIRFVL